MVPFIEDSVRAVKDKKSLISIVVYLVKENILVIIFKDVILNEEINFKTV